MTVTGYCPVPRLCFDLKLFSLSLSRPCMSMVHGTNCTGNALHFGTLKWFESPVKYKSTGDQFTHCDFLSLLRSCNSIVAGSTSSFNQLFDRLNYLAYWTSKTNFWERGRHPVLFSLKYLTSLAVPSLRNSDHWMLWFVVFARVQVWFWSFPRRCSDNKLCRGLHRMPAQCRHLPLEAGGSRHDHHLAGTDCVGAGRRLLVRLAHEGLSEPHQSPSQLEQQLQRMPLYRYDWEVVVVRLDCGDKLHSGNKYDPPCWHIHCQLIISC